MFLTPMGPDVPSIHIMPSISLRDGGRHSGVLFVPKDWLFKVALNPCMQVGAMAYMLSQVRDLWNEKIVAGDTSSSPARGAALEARVLRVLDRAGVLTPNDYQRHVLAAHPEGADDGAWYEGQPFDMARAVAKFQCAIEGVTVLSVGPMAGI